MPAPMEFPEAPYARRHGPGGYEKYRAYKDWLRDEFQFRCVYCLYREKWDKDGWRSFQIDHAIPQNIDKSLVDSYDNLVYCCASCNRSKQNTRLQDPFSASFYEHYRFQTDGTVDALTAEGARLIEVLGLDDPHLEEYRRKVFRNYAALERMLAEIGVDRGFIEPELVIAIGDLLGYPADLPDLRKKRPGTNSRPNGAQQCYFARLERGEISRAY
jgi:hypothetical protein